MSEEEIQSPSNASEESASQAGATGGASTPQQEESAPPMGPLTPVFLVWPRKTFTQTWIFLWVGVALLIGALLPWHGEWDERLIEQTGQMMTRGELQQEIYYHEAAQTEMPTHVFVGLDEPEMQLGALVVLLCALGLVLNGIKNIWTRGLVFWPITLSLFLVLVVLYYSSGASPQAGYQDMETAGAFATCGQLLDHAGGLFKDAGSPERMEFYRIFDRFGPGLYLTMAAWCFLVLVIVGSLVIAIVTSGKKDQGGAAGKGPARGRRPSRR